MSITKKVLLGEFYQESNTFNPFPMSMEDFKASRVLEGKEFYDTCIKLEAGSVKGICDAIEECGYEVIPAVSVFEQGAGGRVADDVYEYACDRMKYYIENSGEYDAVFLSLHGATCTESIEDACGEFVKFVRSLVGDDMIIAASFDLHANITETLLETLDVICGYQTYPHIDIYETGYRAGKFGMMKLLGKTLYQAAVRVPVIVPPSGYSNTTEPFKSVYDYGCKLIENKKLLDCSVFNVQAWLDIECIGSTVVTISESLEDAKEAANKLAEIFFDGRDGYWPKLYSIDEITTIAANNETGKVVVMADAADSANGGAVGDTMEPVAKLITEGTSLSVAMNVRDEETVEKAYIIGEGNEGDFEIGNKLTVGLNVPVKCRAKVVKLSDGVFIGEANQDKGASINIGKTAVLEIGKVSLVVCSGVAASTGDPGIFRGFGIEPKDLDMVIVKANTSFREPYGEFTDLMYYVDAPGASTANLKSLKWNNIPKGLYPFDLPNDYKPSLAKVYRSK